MSNRFKILVIEDESNIRSFAKTILEANDYQVITADTCQTGIMMFSSHRPDLVLLDLGLPDRDGLEFIHTIRTQQDGTPILVLSARTNETDKVEALDLGANDYITKPFGTAELMARVRAALRNSTRGTNANVSFRGTFQLYNLMIDYDRRMVFISGEEIKLTQTEYNILTLLTKHTGKVMTYDYIIKEIWGPNMKNDNRILRVNMANIRRKIEKNPAEPEYIFTEVGVGYRIVEPD